MGPSGGDHTRHVIVFAPKLGRWSQEKKNVSVPFPKTNYTLFFWWQSNYTVLTKSESCPSDIQHQRLLINVLKVSVHGMAWCKFDPEWRDQVRYANCDEWTGEGGAGCLHFPAKRLFSRQNRYFFQRQTNQTRGQRRRQVFSAHLAISRNVTKKSGLVVYVSIVVVLLYRKQWVLYFLIEYE